VFGAQVLLLVDDDDDFRESLAEFLILRGYAVQTAENVGAAIHLSRALGPELILLDLSMPAIDGWDFLCERRKDPIMSSRTISLPSPTKSSRCSEVKRLKIWWKTQFSTVVSGGRWAIQWFRCSANSRFFAGF
jgi:CheY-like chemotaxis protein